MLLHAAPWLRQSRGAGNPKGFYPYNPLTWRKGVASDVLRIFAELEADDALPIGPRTTGYSLSMRENLSGLRYTKATYKVGNTVYPYPVDGGRKTEAVLPGWATFKDVEDAVKRLRQAEQLPWEWVTDGSAVFHAVSEDTTAEGFASRVLSDYEHDLRVGQSVVVELHSESAELTPLLERICIPLGTRVESGSGSAGPALARKVAIRAWNRYVAEGEDGKMAKQRTLLLGVGDLDKAGVQNVMRPHIENVGNFLLGFALRLTDWGEGVSRIMVEKILDFERVAVTPEQTIGLDIPGLDHESLIAYGKSGDDDWNRDLALLTESVEVEALGPQRLREAVTTAIESALDMDALEQARADAKVEQKRVREMRRTLGLEGA
jgi:hypothetical protein